MASRAQLFDAGFSKHEILTLTRRGWLHRIHRGVYAVGHTRLTLRGRWMAAVLACGEGAVLSHGDAAALHNLSRAPAGAIHVTAPGRRRHDGIRCHHGAPTDNTVIDGIPVTGLARTILDRAEQLPLQRIRTMLDTAIHQRSLDAAELRRVIAASPGRRTAELTEALNATGDIAPWTQSELERAMLEITRAAGLPEPRVNVLVDGELVDFYWPAHAFIAEVDGFEHHRTHRAFSADRRRDAQQAAAGRRTVRFTYADVMRRAATVTSQLAAMLAAA